MWVWAAWLWPCCAVILLQSSSWRSGDWHHRDHQENLQLQPERCHPPVSDSDGVHEEQRTGTFLRITYCCIFHALLIIYVPFFKISISMAVIAEAKWSYKGPFMKCLKKQTQKLQQKRQQYFWAAVLPQRRLWISLLFYWHISDISWWSRCLFLQIDISHITSSRNIWRMSVGTC